MNQGNEITGTIIIIKNTRKSDTAKMYINIFKKIYISDKIYSV